MLPVPLMMGSVWSPAAHAAHDETVDGTCPLCSKTLGTLDHIMWQCTKNPPPRSIQVHSMNPLQKRLGWIFLDNLVDAALPHMTSSVKLIWAHKHQGGALSRS